MRTTELEGCCGVKVFYDFSRPDAFDDRPLKARLTAAVESEADGGIGIATTIPSQRNAVKALRSLGFKVIKRFKNPTTRNTISMWMRKL